MQIKYLFCNRASRILPLFACGIIAANTFLKIMSPISRKKGAAAIRQIRGCLVSVGGKVLRRAHL